MKQKFISNKELRKANKKLERLMLETLNTKTGGKANKVLRNITGNLRRKINSFLYIENNTLMLDMEMVHYYQYLDEGTKRIKNPWFLTEDFTGSKEFREVIRSLIKNGIEGAVFDVISTNK